MSSETGKRPKLDIVGGDANGTMAESELWSSVTIGSYTSDAVKQIGGLEIVYDEEMMDHVLERLSQLENVDAVTIRLDMADNFDNLYKVYDKLVNLNLKKLVIIDGKPGNSYWTQKNLTSIANILSTPCLRDISLIVGSWTEFKQILHTFMSCPRCDFHSLTLSKYDNSVLKTCLGFNDIELDILEDKISIREYIKIDFPIVDFIQKFEPNSRKFQFESMGNLIQAAEKCLELVRSEPDFKFELSLREKRRGMAKEWDWEDGEEEWADQVEVKKAVQVDPYTVIVTLPSDKISSFLQFAQISIP